MKFPRNPSPKKPTVRVIPVARQIELVAKKTNLVARKRHKMTFMQLSIKQKAQFENFQGLERNVKQKLLVTKLFAMTKFQLVTKLIKMTKMLQKTCTQLL